MDQNSYAERDEMIHSNPHNQLVSRLELEPWPLTQVQGYLTLPCSRICPTQPKDTRSKVRTELTSSNPQTPLLEIKIPLLSSNEHLRLSQILSANNHRKGS